MEKSMRITARGWHRNAGQTLIMDHELAEAEAWSGPTATPNVLYERRIANGGIGLYLGPAAITLGGRYLLDVEFSKDDITRMFLSCYPTLKSAMAQIFPPENSEDDD